MQQKRLIFWSHGIDINGAPYFFTYLCELASAAQIQTTLNVDIKVSL